MIFRHRCPPVSGRPPVPGGSSHLLGIACAAAALAGAPLALGACGGTQRQSVYQTPPTTSMTVPAGERVTLGAADSGAGTGVLVGGTLEISLPTASRGPLPWELLPRELVAGNTTVLGLLGRQRSGTGSEVLTFRAEHPGAVTLRLRNTATGTSWYAVVAVFAVHFSPRDFRPPEPGVVRHAAG